MKITASVAVSSDGYMDDSTPQRLVLSDDADWKEVHSLRAQCDAILVGAQTVRRDNPSLVLRDERLRRERVSAGRNGDITKVVVSGSGNLSPDLRFFTEGAEAPKIVITTPAISTASLTSLSSAAKVLIIPEITAQDVVKVLRAEGIGSLLVEGGAKILRMFMDEDMLDSMRLAISPVLVNDRKAPRLPYFGNLPFETTAVSKAVKKVGKMTVHEYNIHSPLTDNERAMLLRAIELSRRSRPCDTAYRVGCVIETRSGNTYEGYTHETDPLNHAEEEAVTKAVTAGDSLNGAEIFTSMEPCSTRRSKPVSCSELIIRHGISKVVYAYAEPDCLACCEGTRILREAGTEVVAVPEYSADVIEINLHIIDR